MLKPEVFFLEVELEPPSPRYPAGKTGKAYFTFVDGVVTVTDMNGQHLRDGHDKEYTRKLDAGADTHVDAELNAGRLFKEFIKTVGGNPPRGFSGGGGNGNSFGGPLNYPRGGWR
jgi:hypothetical protein